MNEPYERPSGQSDSDAHGVKPYSFPESASDFFPDTREQYPYETQDLYALGSGTQFDGVDHSVTQAASEKHHETDAFAYLFQDQQNSQTHPQVDSPTMSLPREQLTTAAQMPAPAPADAAKNTGGRSSGFLKSSAVMAAGTLVSRLTGFVRTVVITAALGAATLGDVWTVAYTLPTMIYILTVGGGLNSVFVPQLVRSMKTTRT